MPILLILCVKKNVQLFGFVLGFRWAGIFFYFLLQFLCVDFHNSSKAGTADLGFGGQFLECKFRTFKKKVRTASDKFITRLNLIMSRSSSQFSEPFSQSPLPQPFFFLVCVSPFLQHDKHTDASTLRCSSENCEVHVHPNVTKKELTPHV